MPRPCPSSPPSSSAPAAASASTTSTRGCSTSASSSSAPPSTTRSPTSSWPSCCTSSPRTPTRTSRCTSTRRAARSTPASRSTTRCSSSSPTCSTICCGIAMSMGSLLLAGGAAGKRISLPNSRILIHQPSAGFEGQATDIEIHAQRDPQDAPADRRDLREAHGQAGGGGAPRHGARPLLQARRGRRVRPHRPGHQLALNLRRIRSGVRPLDRSSARTDLERRVDLALGARHPGAVAVAHDDRRPRDGGRAVLGLDGERLAGAAGPPRSASQ